MSKTLVLGGGGPVGIAWEAGVAAGLAEAGVRIADADRIIGTSAGAFVGAQLASGRDPHNFAQAQIAQGEKDNVLRAAGDKPAGVSSPGDLTPLIKLMMTPLKAGETRQMRMARFGALALAAELDLDEAGYLNGFGRAFERDWPERFACTAVDAETGAFVMWDRSSRIELVRGVASSCAVPAIFPPVSVNGARFIDGGIRSPTNIDLAKGADKVLALAVVGEVGREMQIARIGPELQALGSTPHRLITPDAGSLAAFGPNLMDAARRADICRAGMEQGRREAEALNEFWS